MPRNDLRVISLTPCGVNTAIDFSIYASIATRQDTELLKP